MYDQRGRMTKETKNLTGAGTFMTQWSYNSADLVTSMTYPGGNGGEAGEVVNTTYLSQMAVSTLIGYAAYVQGSTYDATGRLEDRLLGVTGSQLKLDYNYYAWNASGKGGLLQQIKVDKTTGPATVQNLIYTYDPAGNVKTILEPTNSNQKQCFSYDTANRLTKATTSTDSGQGCTTQLGTGNYDESYTYDSITGNLLTKTRLGT